MSCPIAQREAEVQLIPPFHTHTVHLWQKGPRPRVTDTAACTCPSPCVPDLGGARVAVGAHSLGGFCLHICALPSTATDRRTSAMSLVTG